MGLCLNIFCVGQAARGREKYFTAKEVRSPKSLGTAILRSYTILLVQIRTWKAGPMSLPSVSLCVSLSFSNSQLSLVYRDGLLHNGKLTSRLQNEQVSLD